jgi:2,4-diketo-3-deoxy-L-fuconate hydrolase
MRVANVGGRAKLVVADGMIDVASASDGSFGPGLPGIYERWEAFTAWEADKGTALTATERFEPTEAGPPSPSPRQTFAVALNYSDHAREGGFDVPDDPLFFTKFVSAFSGPVTEVALPPGHVDWETELVVVLSGTARHVPPGEAWPYVAGVTVGQDLSERVLQRSGPSPQFSLAKSYAGFAPQGPYLVTADELDNHDDLAIGCEVNGVTMQSARTSRMLFPVAELIAYLSRVVTLYPGDVIFTGTPPGVGAGRTPPVFLKAGDVLVSHIEGIGELRQTFA